MAVGVLQERGISVSHQIRRRLLAHAGVEQGGHIVVATVQKCLTVVSAVLTDAKRNKIIQKNPARMIDLPLTRRTTQYIPSPVEIQKLLDALAKEPQHYRMFYLLSLCTGYRRGERCALKWEDFKFSGGVLLLTISRSRSVVPGKGVVEGPTKNGHSREIVLSPDIRGIFMNYRRRKQMEAWQAHRELSPYLFTDEHGQLIHPDTFTKRLRKIYESIGFSKEYHLHTLRHLNGPAPICPLSQFCQHILQGDGAQAVDGDGADEWIHPLQHPAITLQCAGSISDLPGQPPFRILLEGESSVLSVARLELPFQFLRLVSHILPDAPLGNTPRHSNGLGLADLLPVRPVAVADSDFESAVAQLLDTCHISISFHRQIDFVLVVIRFVTEGNFLLPLLLPELAVGVLVDRGSVPRGISICTTLQSAAKPDQTVCKTTMPTMVASRIRTSQIEIDSADRRLGGEIENSFFFPACFNSARIWATSRARASVCSWVGRCPT